MRIIWWFFLFFFFLSYFQKWDNISGQISRTTAEFSNFEGIFFSVTEWQKKKRRKTTWLLITKNVDVNCKYFHVSASQMMSAKRVNQSSSTTFMSSHRIYLKCYLLWFCLKHSLSLTTNQSAWKDVIGQ